MQSIATLREPVFHTDTERPALGRSEVSGCGERTGGTRGITKSSLADWRRKSALSPARPLTTLFVLITNCMKQFVVCSETFCKEMHLDSEKCNRMVAVRSATSTTNFTTINPYALRTVPRKGAVPRDKNYQRMKRIEIGQHLETNYGTGPYMVTDIKRGCTCGAPLDWGDENAKTAPHLHMALKGVGEGNKSGGEYTLGWYDEETLKSVIHSEDSLTLLENTTLIQTTLGL